MPVKWDSQHDQKLLLLILEAHPTLSVDVKKVAELWPTRGNDSDQPTPRAIHEHLGVMRKQAGINTSIRTTGARAKLKPATRIKNELQNDDMLASQTPPDKLNFIRSSFSTPFRTSNKRGKNGSSTKKRKRLGNSSDEEEAVSSDGSDSEVNISSGTPTKSLSIKSSARRRPTKPKYDLAALQDSNDDEDQVAPFNDSDSDGGYDPVKAAEEKRGRSRKVRQPVKEESE